jgi:phage tail protein X
MSKIKYTDDDKVIERKGEFFEISSCYATPRSVETSMKDYGDNYSNRYKLIDCDVDELLGKPRRFFDKLLSIVEAEREANPGHSAYYGELIKGCEMWLSAVENGLYGEVEKLAEEISDAR